MDAFEVLQAQISDLKSQLAKQPRFKRGQIVSTNPLRVKWDGSDTLDGEPDSFVPISSLSVGDYVDLRLDGTRVVIVGSVGSPMVEAWSGTVVITPSAANTVTGRVVTFPAGRFSGVPSVTVSAATSALINSVTVSAVSAVNCNVWLSRPVVADTTINVVAVYAP